MIKTYSKSIQGNIKLSANFTVSRIIELSI